MPTSLLIPEILRAIFDLLDAPALLSAAAVCKAWNRSAVEALWSDIQRLCPNEAFCDLARKYGHHVRSLDIILGAQLSFHLSDQTLLTYVLQETPRLKKLSVDLDGCTRETLLAVFAVINSYVAGNLSSLSLSWNVPLGPDKTLYRMAPEDALAFLPALAHIKELHLDVSPTDETIAVLIPRLPNLIAVTFKEPVASGADTEYLGDDSLRLIGQTLAHLRDITINFNHHITSTGLIAFSIHCRTLERLDLCYCPQLDAGCLEALVEASPLLTNIRLDCNRTSDEVLLKLASPQRAARLKTLWIGHSLDVTTAGVQSIVRSCSGLLELGFSDSPNVSMDLFAGSDWECIGLRILKYGGIHQSVVGPGRLRARRVVKEDLVNMYRQLRRLGRLEELDMSSLPFELRLFEMGRPVIESMRRLGRLVLTDRKDMIADKEAIWLATYLPSLRTLQVSSNRVKWRLMMTLQEINSLLDIEVLDRPPRISNDILDSDDSSEGPEGLDSPSLASGVSGFPEDFDNSDESYEFDGSDRSDSSDSQGSSTSSNTPGASEASDLSDASLASEDPEASEDSESSIASEDSDASAASDDSDASAASDDSDASAASDDSDASAASDDSDASAASDDSDASAASDDSDAFVASEDSESSAASEDSEVSVASEESESTNNSEISDASSVSEDVDESVDSEVSLESAESDVPEDSGISDISDESDVYEGEDEYSDSDSD